MLLPAQKFFIPNKNFLPAMSVFKKDKIYDVGAGMGHVTRLLHENGFNISGVDIFPREDQDSIVKIIEIYSLFTFNLGSIAMYCRPSHGSFLHDSLESAFSLGCKSALYVGLVKNFDIDLGDVESLWPHADCPITLLAENVGEEKENIWQIKFPESLERL